MKLYNISEKDILKVIELPDTSGIEGHKMISIKMFHDKFLGNPLKVVYEKTEHKLFIITVYPLKNMLWR